MAGQAGGAVQGLRVAVTARSAAVVDPASPFIRNAGMWATVSRRPVIDCMTRSAVEAEQAGMEGRIAMAAGTGRGQTGKLTRRMALLTSQAGMPACQGEPAAVMIEIRILPVRGVVAGGTIRAILAVMLVILPVAGIAVGGRAHKNPVQVTRLAGDFLVLAFKLESRQVVIELRRGPAVLCMAVCTVGAITSSMGLIPLMARDTIPGGQLKICLAARIVMALIARQPGMLSLEREGEDLVIEVFIEAVDTIVTVQAGRAVR